jgi:hypothetical protein
MILMRIAGCTLIQCRSLMPFLQCHPQLSRNEEVVDAAPLNQGPPSTGARVGRKRGVKPQPDPAQTMKRQKIGVPLPKKQRPVASG